MPAVLDLIKRKGTKKSPKRFNVYVNSSKEIPQELLDIQVFWSMKADRYGDVGPAVSGAGFVFKYQGEYFEMIAVTKWQGATSWEHCKDEIFEKLNYAGCTDVSYNWGSMS